MADSILHQILDAIETRFKTILTTGGYNLNLGSTVEQWRTTPYGKTDTPALKFQVLSAEPAESGTISNFTWRAVIAVTLTITDGTQTQNTALQAIDDVLAAIGTDHRWGGLAKYTEHPGYEIELSQNEVITASVKITFGVIYQTTGLWKI